MFLDVRDRLGSRPGAPVEQGVDGMIDAHLHAVNFRQVPLGDDDLARALEMNGAAPATAGWPAGRIHPQAPGTWST